MKTHHHRYYDYIRLVQQETSSDHSAAIARLNCISPCVQLSQKGEACCSTCRKRDVASGYRANCKRIDYKSRATIPSKQMNGLAILSMPARIPRQWRFCIPLALPQLAS